MSAGRDALRLQERLEDLVGGARIDVVGAFEHPALHVAAFLAHEVFDRGDRLLIGRGAGIEDVVGALLALILHGIEEQAVQLLEHRQHRFARHRGPAAEHHRHLVLLQQFARLLGEERPVGCGIDHDRLDLLAEQAAMLVDVVDHHQHGVLERRLADRHGAGQRMQHADLDRVLRLRRRQRRRRSQGAGHRQRPHNVPRCHKAFPFS